MRHRYSVSLYDDYHLDAELIDYISDHGKGRRQELLRSLIRAGYTALVQQKSGKESIISSINPDELKKIVSLLDSEKSSAIEKRTSHAHKKRKRLLAPEVTNREKTELSAGSNYSVPSEGTLVNKKDNNKYNNPPSEGGENQGSALRGQAGHEGSESERNSKKSSIPPSSLIVITEKPPISNDDLIDDEEIEDPMSKLFKFT